MAAKQLKKSKSKKKQPWGKRIKDTIAREVKYIKRGEKRISTVFFGGITVMLVTVLLVIFIAFISVVQKLDNSIYDRTNSLKEAISNNIVATIVNHLNNNNMSILDETIQPMIKSRLISYCVVTDSSDSYLLYSSIINPTIDGNTISRSSLSQNKMLNTECKVQKTPKFNVYIGFSVDETFMEQVKNLLKPILFALFISLFLGLWLTGGLYRKILKPVKALIQTTGAFASGDLTERIDRTSFIEFNELIDSYNGMADSIQKLYSSLEHKVQERTQQLKEAIKELQNTQAMMVHSEKMKSLGELVAGIMHEINNPINFIYGNMTHLKNYSNDLFMIIDKYIEYSGDLTPEHKAECDKLLQEVEYDFLKEDLPDLIKSCHEGTERTKNIILNLKDFSRMEESAITNVDLPKEIDSTLNILNNKFKHGITVHKDYHEDVPKIEAYGGQLNQVFMNILDNAAFAVADKAKDNKGEVWVTISKDANFAYIEIKDNGKGMSEETKDKIFNPFFTTKPVGQGTGLGLSISYKVIKNHKGTITVDSEEGQGTTFTIKLPLVFVHQQQIAENKDDIEVI